MWSEFWTAIWAANHRLNVWSASPWNKQRSREHFCFEWKKENNLKSVVSSESTCESKQRPNFFHFYKKSPFLKTKQKNESKLCVFWWQKFCESSRESKEKSFLVVENLQTFQVLLLFQLKKWDSLSSHPLSS